MSKQKTIGIFTPCLNEEKSIRDCYEAVKKLFKEQLPNYSYQHLFSDNGSKDQTVAILKDIANNDPNVRVIVNSRNFGFGASCFNGLKQIEGDAVLTFMPADMQDPPELIPTFVKHWEEGYQVVYGIRKKREENFLMRSLRDLHYKMVKSSSAIEIPVGAGEFQLVDRQVINALRDFDDYDPYIRGMLAYCGFKKIGVPYTWKKREKGKTTTNLYYLIHFGLNGLIFFSNAPMRICMLSGFTIAAASMLWSFYSVIAYLTHTGTPTVRGIPLLIAALFFFAGIQLFFLGIIGEYIAAIHSQVRKRPLVIEAEKINF